MKMASSKGREPLNADLSETRMCRNAFPRFNRKTGECMLSGALCVAPRINSVIGTVPMNVSLGKM